jgi:hypothetical protein
MNRGQRYILVLAAVFMAAALIVVGFSMLPFSTDKSYGQEGCCKTRQCPDDSCEWYVMGGDRASCEKINAEKDGDDVEDESGLVWWDLDC